MMHNVLDGFYKDEQKIRVIITHASLLQLEPFCFYLFFFF